MTEYEARTVWDRHLERGEGWIDAMARLEREGRTLTAEEREAQDVLWGSFMESLRVMASFAVPSR